MAKSGSDGDLWVHASSEDENANASDSNPFVFSDGTQVEDTNTLIKWSGPEEPEYDPDAKCVCLAAKRHQTGNYNDNLATLCKMESECEEEEEKCPMNNGSDRSRANLPVFALFMAGSVFKAFYALVGPAVM